MSEHRDRYHHGDLRRTIIELATAAIREAGEHKFSLRAVARAAGVDIAATYRHFQNRDDVLKAVAVEVFSTIARRMEHEEATTTTSIERLHALGRAYVGFAVEEPALFRMAFGPQGSGGLAMALRGPGDGGLDPHEMLLAALGQLTEEGHIGVPVQNAALPAWAAVHGLAHLAVDGSLTAEEVETATRDVVDTVLRGLSRPER